MEAFNATACNPNQQYFCGTDEIPLNQISHKCNSDQTAKQINPIDCQLKYSKGVIKFFKNCCWVIIGLVVLFLVMALLSKMSKKMYISWLVGIAFMPIKGIITFVLGIIIGILVLFVWAVTYAQDKPYAKEFLTECERKPCSKQSEGNPLVWQDLFRELIRSRPTFSEIRDKLKSIS